MVGDNSTFLYVYASGSETFMYPRGQNLKNSNLVKLARKKVMCIREIVKIILNNDAYSRNIVSYPNSS